MDSKNFGNKSRYLVFLSLIMKSLEVHFSPSLLTYCICKLSSASNLGLPHLFYSISCKCIPSVLATFYAKLYLYKFTILFVSCHSFNSDISSSVCSCTPNSNIKFPHVHCSSSHLDSPSTTSLTCFMRATI